MVTDVVTFLAQSLLVGAALAAIVRLALAILAPLTASTRFSIWFAALIAIAALPIGFVLNTSISKPSQKPAAAEIPLAPAVLPAATVAPHASGAAVSEPAPQGPSHDAQPPIMLPDELAFGFLFLYVVSVMLLLSRIGFSYWRLRRLKAHTFPPPPELAPRFERWLSLCKTGRPVRLRVSDKARSPMAIGFAEPAVIIPDSLLLRLTGEELDHLGVHELAHIRRYDDWTNLVQRLIQSVFFYNPAVHWVSRRLDFEREVACDDWVLTLTGEAKPYARSLAKVLEHSPWRSGPILASGAVFRKQQILRRIEMMLDGSRDSRPKVSHVTLVVVLMCLFGAFTQLVQVPSLIAFGKDGNVHRSRWQMDDRTIETEVRGDVEFGDDDASVKAISSDGRLRIEETRGWSRRKLEVRPGTSSQPEVRYFVDGRERPLDNAGRDWIVTILPTVIRESGFQAEERAARILQRRGADGVLDEIDRIGSDHSRRRYLSTVILSDKLNTDELRRAMSRVERIGSDHDKANVLLEVAEVFRSDQLRTVYFRAVNSIGSDHDRRRVLTRVIQEGENDSAMIALAGKSVEKMGSDHDKAEVLKLSSQHLAALDSEARRALVRAAGSIGSDHDKANVVKAMLSAGDVPPELRTELLRIAQNIGSDHDKANVLESLIDDGINDPSVQKAFIEAVNSIGSDHDRSRVLQAVMERATLSDPLINEIVLSVQRLGSDHEKANVLKKLAGRPVTDVLVGAIRSIGSDHDKAQVLAAFAERYPDDPEIRRVLRKAAETIQSDADYRRIMSKLLAEPNTAK